MAKKKDYNRIINVPEYTAPDVPYPEVKVEDSVLISPGHTYRYSPSDKQGIKPSKDFSESICTVLKIIEVRSSKSQKAYLL